MTVRILGEVRTSSIGDSARWVSLRVGEAARSDSSLQNVNNFRNGRNGRLRRRSFSQAVCSTYRENRRDNPLFSFENRALHIQFYSLKAEFGRGPRCYVCFSLKLGFSIFRRNRGDLLPQTGLKNCVKFVSMREQRSAKVSSRRYEMTRV